MRPARWVVVACAALGTCGLMAVASCGRIGFDAAPGVSAGDGAGSDPGFAVAAPPTMLPLTAVQLAAPGDVTWAIASGGGGITSAGVYSAPAADGPVVVRATASTDASRSATATIAVTRVVTPAAIADVGATIGPSGYAAQTHVVYDAGTWWLFYESAADPMHLLTARSADFATWSPGASVALPVALSGDGRDLAVTDRVLGGHHVVHLSIGGTGRSRYHVRAVLAGGAIAFGAPRLTNTGGAVDPDGPAVAILPSGLVIDGTGWDATPATGALHPCGDGDVEMFTSASPDDGTTSFDAVTFAREVIWCVNDRVNARQLVVDGETLIELFEDGAEAPDPVNVLMTIRQPAGSWLPDETTYTVPPSVFATDTTFAASDWMAVAQGRQLHAVRRVGAAGAYEHRILDLDQPTSWTTGQPIDDDASSGPGLLLEPYGTGILALAIGPGGAIDYTFYAGTAWSAWTALSSVATGRTGIAGTPGAVWWTEGTRLVGARLP